MKTVSEVLTTIRGGSDLTTPLAGKSTIARKDASDLTSALVNDTSFVTTHRGNNGETLEFNISELIRKDLKTTLATAGYPQKSEADQILDKVEISTKGLTLAIPHIVQHVVESGKAFELPNKDYMKSKVYLAPVQASTKDYTVRDMTTQTVTGTSTVTTKDHFTLRAKSPAPDHLQTKVKKDLNGKVVQ